MEILRLTGYSEEEKLQIARRYLIRRQLQDAGLNDEQVIIPDDTLRAVISRYTREAGVRQLERSIGQLARKVAVRHAQGKAAGDDPTRRFVGNAGPRARDDGAGAKDLPAGVATGLAWTETGGEVLYVEAVELPGGHDLTLTGQLGEVMRESARGAKLHLVAARPSSASRPRCSTNRAYIFTSPGRDPQGRSVGRRGNGHGAGFDVHPHARAQRHGHDRRDHAYRAGAADRRPEGKSARRARAGIRRVILPADNAKDLRELPEEVRQEIEFIVARRIEDVLEAAIPGIGERASKPPATDGHATPLAGNGRGDGTEIPQPRIGTQALPEELL